jgi:predicted nuclease with RNAse H fold
MGKGMERSKILQPHMQKEKLIHAGVDFGSKLAGTTVICYAAESGKINFLASAKKQDADEMLRDFFASSHISLICLDAPLSLPAAYKNPYASEDYFYRKADKSLKAMSPLFLGGLTARAMQLKHRLNQSGKEVIEVYPAALAKHLKLKERGYKEVNTQLAELAQELSEMYELNLNIKELSTWHHFDSLLCYISGLRYLNAEHIAVGDEQEGMIHY